MNNSKIRVLALFGLIAAIGSSSAMAQTRIPFTVPFGFTAGARTFAAGDYQVTEVASHVILLQSRDGHAAMVAMCYPGIPGKNGTSALVFHRYGGRYFLSEFRNPSRGLELPMSSGEKELVASRTAPRALDVVASVGK